MNPEEILKAAREAIAAGEDPDDVAAWIEAAGISLEGLETGFAGDGAGRTWQQSGPDLSHLDPFGITKMPMGEFRDKAGRTVQMALGGVGLQSAVKAIRGLRAAQAAARAPMVPSPSGLLNASGAPAMVRGTPAPPRSAMDALKLLAKPVGKAVRRTLPWGGGALLGGLLRD